MEKSVVLVGGGHVSAAYQKAFAESSRFQLVALCDKDANCLSRNLFSNLPFFTDLKEAVSQMKPDLILIATPPATHVNLIIDALQLDCDVLVEKPAVLYMWDMVRLYDALQQTNQNAFCLFHYRYANEVLFWKEHARQLQMHLGDVRKVQMEFYESYAYPDGHVSAERISLQGAWMDTGINMLSIVETLFGIKGIEMQSEETVVDEIVKQPVFVKRVMSVQTKCYVEPIVLELTIDWRMPNHQKTTRLFCEKGEALMSHSTQGVYVDGKTLFEKNTESRLEEHYRNLFEKIELSEANSLREFATMWMLHLLLLS